MPARGLRDRERREDDVQRRAVQVEAVSRGEDEAGHALRDAELHDALEGARERGLGRGRRERDEERLADLLEEPPHGHARELQRRHEDDQREDDEGRVERPDELRVAAEDPDAVMRDGARHGAEHAEGRERHDVVRELEEHGHRGIEELHERLRAVSDVRGRDAEERREDDDLEDVLPGHRVDQVRRKEVEQRLDERLSASRGPSRPWTGA